MATSLVLNDFNWLLVTGEKLRSMRFIQGTGYSEELKL